MARDSAKKRDIEPIFAISMVVFLIASVAVIGVFIDDRYVSGPNREVPVITAGSVVEVDYTGSLYGFYDEDGSLIFDTSVKQNSVDYPTIADYKRTSFSTFKVTPGSGGALEDFEKKLIGKKVGDTVRVTVEPADGYPAENKDVVKAAEIPVLQTMTKEEFGNLYDETLPAMGTVTITTVYGWKASVSVDTISDTVKIEHKPEAGESYDLKNNEKNEYGKATAEVTGIDSGKISYKLGVRDEVASGDGFKMIWFDLGNTKFYAFGDDGTVLKTTENPAAGAELYFVIKVISFT